MRLRLQGVRPSPDAAGPTACAGRAEDGSEWVWLTREASPEPASTMDVEEGHLLEQPADTPSEAALEALLLWPAWRATKAARLELGSGLLILGEGWLSHSLLRLSPRWGVLWRAAVHGAGGPASCEHGLPESALGSAAALARSLPSAPDAVIVTGNGSKLLPLALEVCRTRGVVVAAQDPTGGLSLEVNFYRDAHRRGLTLVTLDPFSCTSRDRAHWSTWASRCTRLGLAPVA